MSLEASIAALTQQAGLLLDLPQTLATAATAKINEVGGVYNSRLAALETTVYINQTTGVDTAAGTAGAPVKTIQRALAMTPLGGRCYALLQGPYTVDAPIAINQRHLLVRSETSVRHVVSFTRRLVDTVTPNLRSLDGFSLTGNASLVISGLRLNVPALDGTWPTYTGSNETMIQLRSSTDAGQRYYAIINCDLDIPASPFGALISDGVPQAAWISSNTLVGAATSLNGKVLRGYTNVAGVAPPAYFQTTLTAI